MVSLLFETIVPRETGGNGNILEIVGLRYGAGVNRPEEWSVNRTFNERIKRRKELNIRRRVWRTRMMDRVDMRWEWCGEAGRSG